MVMTENNPRPEILAGPQRRRRWSAAEKVAMVAETQEARVAAGFVDTELGVNMEPAAAQRWEPDLQIVT